MTVLLSSYRREKWRISKKNTGSGRDSIYVSKWFGFDDFSFMQDKLTPNNTTDTMQEPTSHNQGESSQGTSQETLQQNNEENIVGRSDNMNEQSKEVDTSKVPEKPAKNAKKRKHDEEENEMLTEAFKIPTETSQATY
ncbi:unnamed protein product [Acanthoscelides obtectus]|uniref:Uncharacterized protein n=1 Tax=Acanthoscelides obtectus TaxID=200917 RepID=A0A9P0LV57_ACAOB|nr:unnamed protein product [Acanthoscelides obtectus]CAK1624025.1 hypothetical protein AOBTE_LOCUS2291 [Acanthoscelides obtectus]